MRTIWKVLREARVKVYRMRSEVPRDTFLDRLRYLFAGDVFPLELPLGA